MTPTFDSTAQFDREYGALIDEQKATVLKMVRKFVEDLQKKQGLRNSLRVKKYRGKEGVFEITWAPDGRALFTFGEQIIPGQPHVIWLRIGGHEIF